MKKLKREVKGSEGFLKDDMPFAKILDGGVVVCKDGGLLVSFRFRGPDLDSATDGELGSITQRINSSLLRLGTDWVIYAEAQRKRSSEYATDVYFPDSVTKKIDDERKRYFSSGVHFESEYFFTMYWLPPIDAEGRMKQIMIEGAEEGPVNFEDRIKTFKEETVKFYELLKEILPEVSALNADEYLTYLHSTVSAKRHLVKKPKGDIPLDAFLYDTPLIGGIEPMLGDRHLRVVTPISYVGESVFGMFNALNRLDFEYRWVTKFICMDKVDALSKMGKFKTLWNGKLKSFTTTVIETVTGNVSHQINENARMKADEVTDAQLAIEGDLLGYGYYTTMVVITDRDIKMVNRKAKQVVHVLNNMGFTATTETLNSVDAWFGSIPGMVCNNVRRPLISTANLVHMLPFSDIWAGPLRNKHLNGPCLMYTQTAGNTPFRLSFHNGEVGHGMVVGPTGAGKSVLLAMIAAQFRKYADAQVYVFDKGGSMQVLTAGVDGNFYDLANEDGGALSFQPLAQIHIEKERTWALEWVCDFLRAEKKEITPEIKKMILSALMVLSNSPVMLRTIANLSNYIPNQSIKTALMPMTVDGSYGQLFDSKVDNFSKGKWQVFEMDTIMQTPTAVAPALSYLFHRLEQRLDGSPTLIVLDECWVFFDNPTFEAKIRECATRF